MEWLLLPECPALFRDGGEMAHLEQFVGRIDKLEIALAENSQLFEWSPES